MKNYIYLLIATALMTFALGCSNGNSKNMKNDKSDSLSILSNKKDMNVNSSGCITTLQNFLEWYNVQFNSLNSIQIVELKQDTAISQYRVNFNKATKYIDQIRLSGFFSENYCQDKLQYFKEKDQELVKDKQSDGPPIGFEADLLLLTQEPNEVLKNHNSLKIDQVSPTVFKLISIDNNLLFNVVMKNGKCLIDKISFEKK